MNSKKPEEGMTRPYLEDFVETLMTTEKQIQKFNQYVVELYGALENKDELNTKTMYGNLQIVVCAAVILLKEELNLDGIDAIAGDYTRMRISIGELMEDAAWALSTFPQVALSYTRAACLKSGYDPDKCFELAWESVREQYCHWGKGKE